MAASVLAQLLALFLFIYSQSKKSRKEVFFEILFLKLKNRIFENTNEGFFYMSLFMARQKDENPKFSKRVGVGGGG